MFVPREVKTNPVFCCTVKFTTTSQEWHIALSRFSGYVVPCPSDIKRIRVPVPGSDDAKYRVSLESRVTGETRPTIPSTENPIILMIFAMQTAKSLILS